MVGTDPVGPVGSAEAQVADLIEREVREGRLGPGARLPTERQLAERSGVSRTTVRRALALLEAQGRIIRHVGRGTFLAPARTDPVGPLPVSSTSPAEIMAVRLLIEPQTMPLAATAATPEDFAEMERCLRGGEEHQQQEEFEHWDVAFHRALAAATHNTLLIQIYDIVNDARHHPLWGRLKQRSFSRARCREYIRDHRDIYEALLDRDGPAALVAMRTHVLRVQSNIFDVRLSDDPHMTPSHPRVAE